LSRSRHSCQWWCNISSIRQNATPTACIAFRLGSRGKRWHTARRRV
jgi:hypothetical protein